MSAFKEPILVMGNKNYSSWSFRAWLVMQKSSLDFEEIVLTVGSPEFEQQIGKWSPSGKVPALVDGENVVWDSLSIAEYINENMDENHLWPLNYVRRAKARSISCEMHSGFQALREQMPMNARAVGLTVPVTPELERDIERINQIWCSCLKDPANKGPWLFGDFTIADAMFAPVVLRFNTYGVVLDNEAMHYIETVLADPDVAEWIASAKAEPVIMEQYEIGQPAEA